MEVTIGLFKIVQEEVGEKVGLVLFTGNIEEGDRPYLWKSSTLKKGAIHVRSRQQEEARYLLEDSVFLGFLHLNTF